MNNKMLASHCIAVTGHRFIPNSAKLEKTIRRILESQIKNHPGKSIYLYSALAEGSDQLVARISLEFQEISLCVPLPKPQNDYLEDFATDNHRKSFQKLFSTAVNIIYLSTPEEGQSIYDYLGNYLVKQSDVLIALWNGVYNQKKGGTSDVVRLALKAGKPVYHVYCPNEKNRELYILNQQKHIGELELLDPEPDEPEPNRDCKP